MTKRFYYPALDGLRFFAFLMVLLCHSFQRLPSESQNPITLFIVSRLWIGVDLFFVLSGFLITFLLLSERKAKGSFSLRKFYIRRSLRIWPLYYLALLVGFIIWPQLSQLFLHTDYSDPKFSVSLRENLPLFMVFLGNWTLVFDKHLEFLHLSHLWTVCIEEQFYFIWPLVFTKLRSYRSAFIFGAIVIVLSIFIRLGQYLIGIQSGYSSFGRMDTFMFGALLAFVFVYKNKLWVKLSWLGKPKVVGVTLCFFKAFLASFNILGNGQSVDSIYGYSLIALFCTYFVFAAMQKGTVVTRFLSLSPIVWLGKISFGLYIWHRAAITISQRILDQNITTASSLILCFVINVIMAVVSYYLFERFFLNLKERFEVLKSRPI